MHVFNVHHKDWLTCSGGTDRPGELCCNFSQKILLGSLWLSVLLSWIYLLLTLIFVLKQFSIHCIVLSVSTDFPSNLKRGSPFHWTAYDYCCVNWGGLSNYLRFVQWNDIFQVSTSPAAVEFLKQVQVGIHEYIPNLSFLIPIPNSQ